MRTSPIDLIPHEIAPVQEGMQTQVPDSMEVGALAGAVMAATLVEVEFAGPNWRRQMEEEAARRERQAESNRRHREAARAAADAKRARKNARRAPIPVPAEDAVGVGSEA